MSLALSLLDSKALSADATAFSSSNVTPAASSLVIVVVEGRKASAPDSASLSSPSWLNGAWTACGDVTPSADILRLQAFYGYVNSSTSTDLVAATYAGTQIGCCIHVIEVTGASAASGVYQNKTGSITTAQTSMTTSLTNALQAATSIVLGAFAINSNVAFGQGDAETELGDAGHGSPANRMGTQYKINDTSSVATFTSSNRGAWIAMEIVEATSGGGSALTASFSDTVTLSDAAVKAVGQARADTVTPSDAATKAVAKAQADTVTSSDAIVKGVAKPQADTVTATDAAAKGVGKPVADTATLTDAATKAAGKTAADTVTATDAANKGVGKAAADTVTLSDDVDGFFPPADPKQRTLRGAGK